MHAPRPSVKTRQAALLLAVVLGGSCSISTKQPESRSAFYSTVEELTGEVRGMTVGEGNLPISGTPLANEVKARGSSQWADCADYSNVLVSLLQAKGISARSRTSTLDGTQTEGHTVVEYFDSFLNKWATTDPTFGQIYLDESQRGESLEEISAFVAEKNFRAIKIKYVTANRDAYMRNYYMDPLTDFLNAVPVQGGALSDIANDPHPYLFQYPPSLAQGVPGTFLLEFNSTSDSVELIDPIIGPLKLSAMSPTLWSAAFDLDQGWWFASPSENVKLFMFPRYWTQTAQLVQPENQGKGVDPSVPVILSWTVVASAQTYSVYVGTSPGTKDIFDSGEVSGNWLAVPLAPDTQYYIRLWTKAHDVWSYSDSSFQTGPMISRLISPANGATGLNPTVQFFWSSVGDAQTYELNVGTSFGAADFLDSGQTATTAFTAILKPNTTYYVRLWTEKANTWFHADSRFQTGN